MHMWGYIREADTQDANEGLRVVLLTAAVSMNTMTVIKGAVDMTAITRTLTAARTTVVQIVLVSGIRQKAH